MKLLTETLKKQIPPLYSNEGVENPTIIAHFFNPMGIGDWYVLEGEEQEEGNWFFYGLVDLQMREYGYFSLKELENIKLPFGMTIERDVYWTPKGVNDV